MCIRDRIEVAPVATSVSALALLQLLAAIYHLFHKLLLAAYIVMIYTVSYTHLDVYKRQDTELSVAMA